MFIYYWDGITSLGHKKYGMMHASHAKAVRHALRQQHIIVQKISRQHDGFLKNKRKAITSLDVMALTQQLAMLMEAHVSLRHALEVIKKGKLKQSMHYLLTTLMHDLDNGLSFTDTLRQHPRVFDSFFCALIQASEASGTLSTTLTALAHHYQHMNTLTSNIKKALSYPLIVLVFAGLLSIFLCIVILPQFETLCQSVGTELPSFTRHIFFLTQILRRDGFIFMMILLSGMAILSYFYKYKADFRSTIDIYKLKCPILGKIEHKIAISRLTYTLSMTYAAGIPWPAALTLSADVTHHHVYTRALRQIITDIQQGHDLTCAFERTLLFPEVMIHMIRVGEQSGHLVQVLRNIARHNIDDVEQTLLTVTRLLEPAFMSLIGIIVGGLVIAMYLPLLQLGAMLST